MRVLVIDNYDSFTYNLVQYLGELGAELDVVRNDAATADELVERARGGRVIVSPGPCTPAEAGVSVEAIKKIAEDETPLVAGRYHSLVVDPALPDCLEQSAHAGDVVMAIRHKELPAEGVQFHPESILTDDGKKLLKNFLQGPS